MDLIDWVIEESKWDHKIYLNGVLTTSRRFPPYNSSIIYDSDKYFKVTDEIRIYNKKLTENEWNHVVNVNKGLSFDGKNDYVKITNNPKLEIPHIYNTCVDSNKIENLYKIINPIIELASPAGHKIVINFESRTLLIDDEIYFYGYVAPCLYSFSMSLEEIISDYNFDEKLITIRWARKDADNLKRKIKTDYIVIDWKNIKYWINGIETKIKG